MASESDSWDWHDDSFKLDLNASEGIMSRSLWEEFTGSEENEPFSFFESTPIIGTFDTLECHGNADISSAEASEDSSLSNKRRRMLLFPHTDLDSGSSDDASFQYFSEKLEETNGFLLDDAVDISTSRSSIYGQEMPLAAMGMNEATANCFQSLYHMPIITESEPWKKPAPVVKKPSIIAGSSKKRKLATPVAYPFELVKPCNIEGGVTLEDINQRLLVRKGKKVKEEEEGKMKERSMGVGLSGKSVVGLTRIHTEGHGSITIIRTRT